ncbi:MAG TPA: hypothetical protein PKM78_14765, partial [Anaerolineae bacterium]|nr:hypothetical protein [Anaerolineae bacterium]
ILRHILAFVVPEIDFSVKCGLCRTKFHYTLWRCMMQVVRSEDIWKFIERRTDAQGVGSRSWSDIFPPNEFLELSGTNPIMLRVFEAYQDVPPDPELERLLDDIGQWRLRTEIGPDSPFLDPTDPSIWHPVGPGSVPITLPKGVLSVEVGGVTGAMNPPMNWKGNGPRHFTKKQAEIRTAEWRVTGGQVEFTLCDGSSEWGLWTQVDSFALKPGKSHNKVYRQKAYVKDHWWSLTVKATSSTCEFVAPPFAY